MFAAVSSRQEDQDFVDENEQLLNILGTASGKSDFQFFKHSVPYCFIRTFSWDVENKNSR